MIADLKTLQLKSDLQLAIMASIERLTRSLSDDDEVREKLRARFGPAFDGFSKVGIAPLRQQFGAFRVCGDCLILNYAVVERILQTIAADVRALADGGNTLEADQIFVLYERALVTYTLHELRHRTQGVESRSSVDALKAFAGANIMAELDVLADCDAGKAYALLYAESSRRDSYLRALKECYFLSTQYFFKTFPVREGRDDQIERAVSILLMAARLGLIDDLSAFVEDPELPLDAPLIAKINTETSTLAIMRAEPSRSLVCVANDRFLISSIVGDLMSGDIESAYSCAAIIVRAHNLV